MEQYPLPSVDKNFLVEIISKSPKLLACGTQGKTAWYIPKGRRGLAEKFTVIREASDGQVPYEVSISIALRFGFLPELMEWLEKNRNFKDGAYTVPHKK